VRQLDSQCLHADDFFEIRRQLPLARYSSLALSPPAAATVLLPPLLFRQVRRRQRHSHFATAAGRHEATPAAIFALISPPTFSLMMSSHATAAAARALIAFSYFLACRQIFRFTLMPPLSAIISLLRHATPDSRHIFRQRFSRYFALPRFRFSPLIPADDFRRLRHDFRRIDSLRRR
jgi:hypothetical protein